MIIQHNISALNAHRQLSTNNSVVAKNLEKLSSGYRINRAGDDAAGLAISEKMRSQIKGLETAQSNAQDGISLVQTAEGALTEVHSMLNRMVELATQSANGTYTDGDRDKIQAEVENLKSEIDRISEGTNFNGINLLDGSIGKGEMGAAAGFAIGAEVESGVSIITDIKDSSFSKEGKFEITAGGIDADGNFDDTATAKDHIQVAFTDAKTGDVTNTVLKLSDIVSNATEGGTDVSSAAGASKLAAGDKVTYDLSSVGIGKVTVAYTAESTSISGDLTAIATAVGDVTETGTGGSAGSLKLQVGDSSDKFNQVSVDIKSMSAQSLGIDKIDISTKDGASAAIKTINDAIENVSEQRGELGAVQNRLEHTINNLGVTTENMTAAESRIRDVDMAKEMMSFTKNNVLTQAAQAMLAQANQQPQGVLQLLQ